MKNIRTLDQFLRLTFGVLALLAGFFWLAGLWQWIAYVVGIVLILTAVAGFCPVYKLLGIRPAPSAKRGSALGSGLAVGLLVVLALGGSYASNFLTRKFFLEDFNAMNHFYKQTLFLTGKGEREKAVDNHAQLSTRFANFQKKYSAWQPYSLRGDGKFVADLQQAAAIIASVDEQVKTGDLQAAHIKLEAVRPVFQDMFKRNGFSMLSVALVDFHDAMELMLDAGKSKDGAKVQALYGQVSDKLKAVEVEANDAEIQVIRSSLDNLLASAKDGKAEQLPALAELLKTSFVKVYLKRG